jgi:hypothetical protein
MKNFTIDFGVVGATLVVALFEKDGFQFYERGHQFSYQFTLFLIKCSMK